MTTTPFTFTWSDPASVRRALAQITALASLCDDLSVAISATTHDAAGLPTVQQHITTTAAYLALAAEDLRDAGRQIAALLP